MTQTAIIVGASSGIGEALARTLAAAGYELGLAARRTERLKTIGCELPTKAYVAHMDVTNVEDAREAFFELANAMGSVDLVVISAGLGHANAALEWEPERETIDVNIRGFVAIATAALEQFDRQSVSGPNSDSKPGSESESESATIPTGQLIGISSVAATFGNGVAPAYNASKAFVSTYLEGLRYREARRESDVTITTVEPGYVETEMNRLVGDDRFWVASPETAATQIARAVGRSRSTVYVTRRWRLVAWVLMLLPERVRSRLFA